MVKSMTGYGKGEAVLSGRTLTVEVRSVNNRYFDCTVKLPRVYAFAEERIKTQVQKKIFRGKIDVFVTIGPSETGEHFISLNRSAADGYYKALCELRDGYGLQDDISVSLFAQIPDLFLVERTKENVDAVSAEIDAVTELALADFDAMRVREGRKLWEDIRVRAETVSGLVAFVEGRAPGIVADYRARLTAKMTEVLQEKQLDESRILTEAAIFADKIAVDEETVRLRSHLAQLEQLLDQGGAVGRKLDFLIQEFNREANTIGSKCCDVEITRRVVDMKAEIEKIREQAQNIE